MIRYAMFLTIVSGLALFASAPPPRKIPESVKGAEGLDDALRNLRAQMVRTPVLSAKEALKRFKLPKGLVIDVIAHEPTVKQPLYLTFDERGRMWVTQYKQYPFPAGLKIVSYDRYIRAKFDRVPPPPPKHFPGDDRISIHEDTKGNGKFDKVKTFVDGLNITTAALPGRGGVWVLNPPYLLFYPDKKRTDVAVAKPQVHLSGFGLEDTHAVASSLCWGPDGWLYGAHGSTCTAKIKVEITGDKTTTDFLGQAIWRYHPEKHKFEIYAEGGGNTFGVAFDEKGRVYSGTNWGRYRGLHYVQGGYYVKGWGKHGPLTNPYAFGFFDHMPHVGNADRLVHTFIVYGGGVLSDLQGKIIGVNALQRRLQVTQLHADRSTFRTTEDPFLLTTDDGRFRPVDVKAGPDGCLYVCDLYEPRINHVDPRDNWDRATGRIYRIRPKDHKPAPRMDLAKKSSKELVALLAHKNRWYREMALRLLGDRKDKSVIPMLQKQMQSEKGQLALESLWALHQSGGFGESAALSALAHQDAHVRRWGIRLLGDGGTVSPSVAQALAKRAKLEKDPQVRSQFASSAKRLSTDTALSILAALWTHDEDAADQHIPLLTWWALEAKAESGRGAILKLFTDKTLWNRPLVSKTIVERLMQRWAMAGGKDNLLACAKLLALSPSKADTARLLVGLEKGFGGGTAGAVPRELREAVQKAWKAGAGSSSITLGLRLGDEGALTRALKLIADEKGDRTTRLACLRIFGEIEQPKSVAVLLSIVKKSPKPDVRQEALASLGRYSDARIASEVLALDVPKLPEAVRSAAYNLLATRPAWTLAFLKHVDAGKIKPQVVPLEVVRKMQLHSQADVKKHLAKHWGQVRNSTPVEKKKEMLRIARLLKGGKGDAIAGLKVFEATCAKCHKLFGKGGEVGPDLTGYERDNAMYWIENIADPSAVIRGQYQTFEVQTRDGRTLTGVIAARDKTTVTLRDAEGKSITLARNRIERLQASAVSLMPEGQMKALTEQQVRDLFAYLMKKK